MKQEPAGLSHGLDVEAEIYSSNSACHETTENKETYEEIGTGRIKLTELGVRRYKFDILENFRKRLGDDGYYSYELLGECYIHGMMDGEAMLYQNEADNPVPSQVFEIRCVNSI